MENTKLAGLVILAIVMVVVILYGSYWLTKTISYTVFYEDMVHDSIRELVKAAALK